MSSSAEQYLKRRVKALEHALATADRTAEVLASLWIQSESVSCAFAFDAARFLIDQGREDIVDSIVKGYAEHAARDSD